MPDGTKDYSHALQEEKRKNTKWESEEQIMQRLEKEWEQQEKIEEINNHIDQTSEIALNEYSTLEIFSFTIQIEEAKELLYGNKQEDKTTLIYQLAQVDGITPQDFAKKVLEKAQIHKQAIIQLLVDKRKKLKDNQ
jgi:antitoxin component HigA of HigAB toxin-antitoxin module